MISSCSPVEINRYFEASINALFLLFLIFLSRPIMRIKYIAYYKSVYEHVEHSPCYLINPPTCWCIDYLRQACRQCWSYVDCYY